MKRENLYIVSAALLASTALTTAASAGSVFIATGLGVGAAGGVQTTTAAKRLSAQVFASTPTTATVIGGTNNGLAYRFGSPLSLSQSSFSGTIGVTGAQFRTSVVSGGGDSVRGFYVNTTAAQGSLQVSDTHTVVCGGLVATTTSLIINACTTQTFSGTASIAGFVISAVAFDNATGLATVGGSISIAGTINLGSSAGQGAVFDTTAATAVVTSANSMSVTATAGTPAQINVSATPTFARLVGGFLTATISTVNITHTGAVAADLTTVVQTVTAVGTGNFIRLASAILNDDAVANVTVEAAGVAANNLSNTPTQFFSGVATFTIAPANIQNSYAVVVNFNGSQAIETAAAGTVDVGFGAIGGTASATGNSAAPPGLTGGAVAGLTRSGFNVTVNSVQPSVAQGARTYSSLLRIVNTANTPGTVNVVLRNNETGVVLGTYTSPSILGLGSLQLSSATIEAGAGVTPSAGVLYQANITGNITGYVQHVNWNQDAGFFSDLSGARGTTN
jgi:hypothetical protein